MIARSRRHWMTLALAALAFAQTLAYYAYLKDDPGNYNGAGATGDQVSYILLSTQVLRGVWEGQVHYLPGYPAFLAVGTVLFGDARLGAAILQGVVYALVVAGARWFGDQAFGAPRGLWAAAFTALNPAIGAAAAQPLTEFMTGAVLFATVLVLYRWSLDRQTRWLVLAGVLSAAMAYMRSDYLAMTVVLGLCLAILGWRQGRGLRALGPAAVVVVIAFGLVAPWGFRYLAVTGRFTLYNEDPTSNLTLMGTWFRVFDDRTFAQLQDIANNGSITREEAIRQASQVGPRPELSRRYMEQVRGPYVRPLPETLVLAAENVRLNPVQFAVNHAALAPVLIWAARNPVRQADVLAIPAPIRYGQWALQLALVLLALWEAGRSVRSSEAAMAGLAVWGIFAFLTAVHVLIAVDERFTTPALPLLMTFAGSRVAALVRRYPTRAVRGAVPARA